MGPSHPIRHISLQYRERRAMRTCPSTIPRDPGDGENSSFLITLRPPQTPGVVKSILSPGPGSAFSSTRHYGPSFPRLASQLRVSSHPRLSLSVQGLPFTFRSALTFWPPIKGLASSILTPPAYYIPYLHSYP